MFIVQNRYMQTNLKYYTIKRFYGENVSIIFYCFVFISQLPGFGPGFQRVCYYKFQVIVYFETYFHYLGTERPLKNLLQNISFAFVQGICYNDFMKFIPKSMARNAKETHMRTSSEKNRVFPQKLP